MSTITTRAMKRLNSASGLLRRKQNRQVVKGQANGRTLKHADGTTFHPTKNREGRA